MSGCFPTRNCPPKRMMSVTEPSSFLRKKKTSVTGLNNCCPKRSATGLNNCHPKRSVMVLKAHCSAGAAIAAVLPAALAFHSADCCIAAVEQTAGLIHAVPAVLSGAADLHRFRGYCGSAGWCIRCSALACCNSAKSRTVAPVLAAGWWSGAVVADPADGYRLPCQG